LPATTKAGAPGRLGPLPGVARCHHRVAGLEAKQLAVRLRRELVRDVEMATKGLLLLAADQADQVILLNRPAHRHRRRPSGRGWPDALAAERCERATDRLDEMAKIGSTISGKICDHDLRRKRLERCRPFFLLSFHKLRHPFCLCLTAPALVRTSDD